MLTGSGLAVFVIDKFTCGVPKIVSPTVPYACLPVTVVMVCVCVKISESSEMRQTRKMMASAYTSQFGQSLFFIVKNSALCFNNITERGL